MLLHVTLLFALPMQTTLYKPVVYVWIFNMIQQIDYSQAEICTEILWSVLQQKGFLFTYWTYEVSESFILVLYFAQGKKVSLLQFSTVQLWNAVLGINWYKFSTFNLFSKILIGPSNRFIVQQCSRNSTWLMAVRTKFTRKQISPNH